MSATHNITLDITKQRLRLDQSVHVRVGDASSQIVECQLTKAGAAYTPPSGSTAKIEVLKADNTWSVSNATISGTKVTATLPTQAISCPGECKRAYFRLIDGSAEDTTEDFYLAVYANATDEAIESKPYADQFEELLEESSAELSAMLTDFTAAHQRNDGGVYTSLGQAISELQYGLEVKQEMTETPGYFRDTGAIAPQTSTGIEVYSERIDVSDGSVLVFSEQHSEAHNLWMAWCEYDAMGAAGADGFLRRFTKSKNGVNAITHIIVPTEGVKAVALCYRTFGDSTVNIYKVSNKEDVSELVYKYSPITEASLSVHNAAPITPELTYGAWTGNKGSKAHRNSSTKRLSHPHVLMYGKFTVAVQDFTTYKIGISICDRDYTLLFDSGWTRGEYVAEVDPGNIIAVNIARVDGAAFGPDEGSAVGLEISPIENNYVYAAGADDVNKAIDLADEAIEIASGATITPGVYEFPLRWKFWYDHTLIDKITQAGSATAVIPSESLANIEMSQRLGFNVIELNVQQTSDGGYVISHGSSGMFGYAFEHVDGETDVSHTRFDSVTLAWILDNVRFKSKYAKYRTAPLTLREALEACRMRRLIPFVSCSTEELTREVERVMGRGNYIAYNGKRKWTSAPITTYKGYTTKEDIINYCESIGVPYIYCMSNVDSFTDEELADIVGTLHEHGYFITSAYTNPIKSNRIMRLGFDGCAATYCVPDFQSGNLANLRGDVDFSDFDTDGTVSGNNLVLSDGQSVSCPSLNSVFLGAGSLRVRFDGVLRLTIGGYASDLEIESDGDEMWFSTYFIEQQPTFNLVASGPATVFGIEYKASKF